MKHRDPYLSLGAFLATGGLLLLLALFFWGAFKHYQNGEEFVLLFDSSLNGLEIGAPVKFKGVTIGRVQDILLRFDPDDIATSPVIAKIDKALLKTAHGGTFDIGSEKLLDQQIQKGLRAKLEYQSYVTGRVFIDIDYYPNEPVTFLRKVSDRKCIPTVPSQMRELWKTLMETLDEIKRVDFVELAKSMQGSFHALQDGIHSMESAADAFRHAISPGSTLMLRLDRTLGAIEDAAGAIRFFAEFMERNPNALLTGKSVH